MSNPFEPKMGDKKAVERKIERVEPVTFGYLRDHFFSEEFYRRLDETLALFLKGNKRELGFVVMKDLQSSETIFSQPIGAQSGDPDTCDLTRAFRRLENKMDRLGKPNFARMGTFHFHSDSTEVFALTPSVLTGDLDMTADRRKKNQKKFGLDVMPIEIVGAPSLEDKEISLLVYREPEHFSMGNMKASLRELDTTLEHTNDSQAVLDEMRHYQYKVELFRTKNHRIEERELYRLEDFAYAPKSIENRP